MGRWHLNGVAALPFSSLSSSRPVPSLPFPSHLWLFSSLSGLMFSWPWSALLTGLWTSWQIIRVDGDITSWHDTGRVLHRITEQLQTLWQFGLNNWKILLATLKSHFMLQDGHQTLCDEIADEVLVLWTLAHWGQLANHFTLKLDHLIVASAHSRITRLSQKLRLLAKGINNTNMNNTWWRRVWATDECRWSIAMDWISHLSFDWHLLLCDVVLLGLLMLGIDGETERKQTKGRDAVLVRSTVNRQSIQSNSNSNFTPL